MADSEVRQRRSQGEELPPTKEPAQALSQLDAEDEYSPWLDVARVVTFLLLASCGLSYVISGGESWAWGLRHRPSFLRPDWWRAQVVRPASAPVEPRAG